MMLTKKSLRKDEIRKSLWKKFVENLTEFFQVCVESLSENKQKRETESELETGKSNWLRCVLKFGLEKLG